MESQSNIDSESCNFLAKTKLPSIGCFVTVMKYVGNRELVCFMARCFSKSKGMLFFKKHIEFSSEFSDDQILSKDSPALVTITSCCHSLFYFKPQASLKEINLKIIIRQHGMLNLLSNLLSQYVEIKFNIECLDVSNQFNTDDVRSILIYANRIN